MTRETGRPIFRDALEGANEDWKDLRHKARYEPDKIGVLALLAGVIESEFTRDELSGIRQQLERIARALEKQKP